MGRRLRLTASERRLIALYASGPKFTREEERLVAAEAQQGSQSARSALVWANMAGVVKLARIRASLRVPVEDLIQEGALALTAAIDQFDPARGLRFWTLAHYWVIGAMLQVLYRAPVLSKGTHDQDTQGADVSGIDVALDIACDLPSPEDAVATAMLSDEVHRRVRLEAKSDLDRALIERRLLATGQPTKQCEIAVETGLYFQAVSTAEKRLLQRLRPVLEDLVA